jgi:hypothetical protein
VHAEQQEEDVLYDMEVKGNNKLCTICDDLEECTDEGNKMCMQSCRRTIYFSM